LDQELAWLGAVAIGHWGRVDGHTDAMAARPRDIVPLARSWDILAESLPAPRRSCRLPTSLDAMLRAHAELQPSKGASLHAFDQKSALVFPKKVYSQRAPEGGGESF
jgi:hypothetical protein